MSVDTSLTTEEFKNGIRINGFVKDGNKYYNNTDTDTGISTCINGLPKRSGANVLCNCVGFAWGAYNETWAKLDPTHTGFKRVRANANDIIKVCKNDSFFKDYIVERDEMPPVGGLIIWEKIHVAYISEVHSKDEITIIQSAYETPSWTLRNNTGTGWCNDKRVISRDANGNFYYSNSTCLGYLANPAVGNTPSSSMYSSYGVTIGNRFYHPHIRIQNEWKRVLPYVFLNKMWKPAMKSLLPEYTDGGANVTRILSANGEFFYGTPYSYTTQRNVYVTCKPSESQMFVNCLFIWNYFKEKGWTLQSVAAMLGNMTTESLLNPGLWQSGNPKTSSGYGLVQWTNSTIFLDWADDNGLSDRDKGDIFYQCEKLMCEYDPYSRYKGGPPGKPITYTYDTESNIQFFASKKRFNTYTNYYDPRTTWTIAKEVNRFPKFAKSTYDCEILTDIFCANYLRPKKGSSLQQRKKDARKWYDMLLPYK